MIYSTFDFEEKFWAEGANLVCGVDEVGRGCFAGPVVAGAVIFPSNSLPIKGVADSKLLKPAQRKELAQIIKNSCVCFGIGEVSVEIINQVGIGKATQIAFVQAVKALNCLPEKILIDAFYIENLDKTNQLPIQGGDRLSTTIAAASIIAKVYRDELMEELDKKFPGYGFGVHKGYGTKFHRDALKKHGLSPIHRTSFNLQKFL